MEQALGAAFAPAASEAEERTYGKVTARIVPFLFICYLAAYLDRVNVGFAKLQMLNELKFSETIYGLGAGIFFLGYVLFEVPSNIILHKVGARIWLARVMLTWAVISAATAFVKTPMAFYIMRFLLGMAEAGFIPGANGAVHFAAGFLRRAETAIRQNGFYIFTGVAGQGNFKIVDGRGAIERERGDKSAAHQIDQHRR